MEQECAPSVCHEHVSFITIHPSSHQ